jgi:flagellar motor switch protein FliM
VRLRVDMEERGGNIEILIPHTTLEPIRDLLTQIFMGENFGQDSVWEKHLGNEIRQTFVDVEAVLDEKVVPMRDVLSFKVGSTLLLDCTANSEITLRCGEVGVSKGKLGRMGDKMAVSITQPPSKHAQTRVGTREMI